MPGYIVKASRDQDWYCMWSTITDCPTFWGSRADLEKQSWRREDVTPERFNRADENGTSAAWPDWPAERQPFGWGDEEFILMETSPSLPDPLPEGAHSGCWLLPRANLRAYCEELDKPDGALAPLLRLSIYDERGHEIEAAS